MLLYVLIGLSLVLLGIAGLQFTYLFYMDRLYRERKDYTQLLEHKCARLNDRLEAAEQKIARQSEMLAALRVESGMEDEVWADVIDDR